MTDVALTIALSALDKERFGIQVARAKISALHQYKEVQDFCVEHRVQLLIARCPASALALAQALEQQGARLMDTLVYYMITPEKVTEENHKNIVVRPMQMDEAAIVEAIAQESFQDYFGHYHADSRLSRQACNEVYTSWAAGACKRLDSHHTVLVAENREGIAGFLTVELRDDEGETVLSGVKIAARKQGIYRALMQGGIHWCFGKGAKTILTSTQLTNIAVQKVWTRLGFELSQAYYTFHQWL